MPRSCSEPGCTKPYRAKGLCTYHYKRTWQKSHLEQHNQAQSAGYFRRRYGLSFEQRDALLALQGSRCAICKGEVSFAARTAHVDHCHTSGEVRGVLCSKCNQALGLFRDSTHNLNEAIEYLLRSRTVP